MEKVNIILTDFLGNKQEVSAELPAPINQKQLEKAGAALSRKANKWVEIKQNKKVLFSVSPI